MINDREQGALKLIDFGIAKAIGNETTNIVRESLAGTVNYMSPEAIVDHRDGNGGIHKQSRASDVWYADRPRYAIRLGWSVRFNIDVVCHFCVLY